MDYLPLRRDCRCRLSLRFSPLIFLMLAAAAIIAAADY